MRWLLDPKVFNYLIVLLYACSAIRWAIEGKWVDVLYWVSAIGITLAVTFGYRH